MKRTGSKGVRTRRVIRPYEEVKRSRMTDCLGTKSKEVNKVEWAYQPPFIDE